MADMLVTLSDSNGNPIQDRKGDPVTTVTADGSCGFTGLDTGSHGATFTYTGDTVPVSPNVGPDDPIDSAAIGDVALSEIAGIVVPAGKHTSDNDAGYRHGLRGRGCPGGFAGQLFRRRKVLGPP